jgi:hypothetical protein
LDCEHEKRSVYVKYKGIKYKQEKYLIQKRNVNLQRMEGGKLPKKTILIATRTRRDIRDYQEQAQFNSRWKMKWKEKKNLFLWCPWLPIVEQQSCVSKYRISETT